ncbi:cytochrome c family protein [Roseomonas sp. SSH11]|uniref:Cytochrome c family protein n=1 Tax=Pararoseomonas baculiformis TaxID=2820812 RepID=A0ABS4AE82_9PROT|nr:cytochrome c family protein [Pararoseomonas baculiformis]MBP0444833.1 cytochrome c family protein [Pararoseomonas baculiformis]
MKRQIGVVLPVLGLLLGAALPDAARAQDAEAGQRVFGQCRACHTVEAGGRNGVGPNLHGVFGRKAASVEGFRYSAAMRQKGEEGLTWTAENLRPYLANPRAVVPGTSMVYPGLRNEEQLTNLIAYLEQATR